MLTLNFARTFEPEAQVRSTFSSAKPSKTHKSTKSIKMVIPCIYVLFVIEVSPHLLPGLSIFGQAYSSWNCSEKQKEKEPKDNSDFDKKAAEVTKELRYKYSHTSQMKLGKVFYTILRTLVEDLFGGTI